MVLCDFNENLDTKPVNQLIDITDTVCASYIIQGPTCFKPPRGTLIDLIITPNKQSIKSHGHFDTGLTDFHHLIYAVLKSFTRRLVPRKVTYRAYKGFNLENYLSDLLFAPFHVAEIFEDMDDQYWFCGSLITNITKEHAPLKIKTTQTHKHPSLNKKY